MGPIEVTVEPAIRAIRVTKTFGPRVALRGVNLNVLPGERIALLGPNGAGKTTLIRVLALLTRPTSGAIAIAGFDASSDAQEIRSRIGVCLHDSLLYQDLSVVENLRFFGRLYRVRDLDARMGTVLERLDLARFADRRVRHLSRGQRQRSSLARALIHDPPVLLLDEPETGQDQASLERMQIELTSSSSRTVVFATHQPSQAVSLATHVLLLDGGRARDLGAADALEPGDVQRALLTVSG
ncbi:MAG TPA: ABC transporter ATP-binding protein [Dehalococcoidia bacterium]|nr:ABC transporter ATP-binding protein [Dehalococcoidia bacterium]